MSAETTEASSSNPETVQLMPKSPMVPKSSMHFMVLLRKVLDDGQDSTFLLPEWLTAHMLVCEALLLLGEESRTANILKGGQPMVKQGQESGPLYPEARNALFDLPYRLISCSTIGYNEQLVYTFTFGRLSLVSLSVHIVYKLIPILGYEQWLHSTQHMVEIICGDAIVDFVEAEVEKKYPGEVEKICIRSTVHKYSLSSSGHRDPRWHLTVCCTTGSGNEFTDYIPVSKEKRRE
ncbi:hypothetical protein K474DRAFT_1678305 [Panus rudis PR-1116 ss-1]|nr:hypothetical protein K474DRAFT_1678305 [Panus rudis PR-1116 ss-1]